ncbi:unnamed protein product [Ceutorhynchus assimilis]|uniref:LIM zinc-binding domain-containing protein n=1 Tax=Ceutorhynchus assimilis TaxID=467358 RepID=A0A9N9MGW8_9CUCU|nr:unnamed protein product [Ceutorhynchus assimilis]
MGERKGTKGLELWCRKMTQGYPGVKVENMTTSWRDGLAFCAIIHYFRPDLIEFDKLNKDDIYGNNELAFRIAEEKLGIPALLEPEDMVEYEVPDRLSILTYLSQFYQTFENQRGKSGARIAPKRPQSSPDHGIVSPASTSPPSKVQITLGKARKQPCAKCGFPVFIAERLNVGKLLYHRTCFRCARCNSQLTLANYYETENGEFCCEICPDEEKQISKKVPSEMLLRKSLSDEEKSASLHTHSETPDAYSTHFETALEFSLDRDLRKSSTLTETECTEFSKARSHFFHSQMESSSDTGSDDIPAELPKSKPPPLINTQFLGEDTTNTKPPLLAEPEYISITDSDKKDMHKVSDSVSTEQTDDHFVTKDNAFSSNRVSVRARMKLFENNEDNINKSDIHSFSSSHNSVPFSSVKKKATVVAIDDLEDFDNISRKSSSSYNVHSNDKQNDENVTVDEKTDYTTKECNLDFSGNETNNNIDKLKSEADVLLEKTSEKYSDIVDKNLDYSQKEAIIYSSTENLDSSHIELSESSQHVKMPECKIEAINTSCIEILDSSQEAETTHSEKHDIGTSYIEILDSSEEVETTHSMKDDIETNQHFKVIHEGDISSETANDQHNDNVSDIVIETCDNSQETKIKEDILTINDSLQEGSPGLPLLAVSEDSFLTADSEISLKTMSSDEGPMHKRGYHTAYDYLAEDSYVNESIEQSLECVGFSKDNTNVDTSNENGTVTEKHIHEVNVCDEDSAASQANEDITEVIRNEDIHVNSEVNDSDAQIKAPNDDLDPFDDNSQSESTPPKPLGATDEENLAISTNQLPPPRTRKKKIAITLEDSLLSTPDTPGFYDKVYDVKRVSINPFGDDENDEDVSYNPFEEDARREEQEIMIKKKISPRVEDMKRVKSYNPFEDDEDEELEQPVRPVPIPVPRTKATRPEPKPRDTLSITSRGSHGGSNSSISSGSAVGSARKKKPAPRPPVPFHNNEFLSMPGSSTASPSQSLTESPNLSGTIRSRKNRRAPPPPKASTPIPPYVDNDSKYTVSCEVSPVIPVIKERVSFSAEKNVKDEVNRNRQSQIQNPPIEIDNNMATDKSTAGRWKRRKGQAPSRPIPEKRIVKTLPLSEIKRELDTIEIQQQGLEKQGIRLEQIIREKCEGPGDIAVEDPVPIDVEDLILQLFELVNEKNELFRRQAELMYLRRQQRLEEEYADVEYQIRCLILQPDANKSDYDKVKEETLINRLVEIVERRNEIIDCLEMDRRRETEEDNSIRSQLNLYSSKRDDEKDSPSTESEAKKKKKHKKISKIIQTFKHKKEKDLKVDIDKDVDETEVSEKGKKKKFNLF